MGEMARLVVDQRIGAKFPASLFDGPPFRTGDQRCAYALPPDQRIDVPAFEIGDPVSAATVHDIPDGQFGETDRLLLVVHRQQHLGWFMTIAGKKPLGGGAMLLEIVGPQREPQANPLADVVWPRCTNVDHPTPLSPLPGPALEADRELSLAIRKCLLQRSSLGLVACLLQR